MQDSNPCSTQGNGAETGTKWGLNGVSGGSHPCARPLLPLQPRFSLPRPASPPPQTPLLRSPTPAGIPPAGTPAPPGPVRCGLGRAGLLLPGGGPGGRWLLGSRKLPPLVAPVPSCAAAGARRPHPPPRRRGQPRPPQRPPGDLFCLFSSFLNFFLLPSNSSPLALGRIPTGFAAAVALRAPFGSRPAPGEPPLPSPLAPPLPGGPWPR